MILIKGVILAGGEGSRLRSLTEVTNKHLLPVYDEPMIFKPIRTLTRSGITDITIVLGGENVGDFIRLLGDGSRFGATFNYVYQKQAGGIAEALYLTRKIIGKQKVAVILGDNVFDKEFSQEIQAFKQSNTHECNLFLKKVKHPEKYGVALLDQNQNIELIREKPKNPQSNYAVTGIFFYDSHIYDVIEKVIEEIGYSERGELEITDVNNIYIERGKYKAHIINEFWCDAGSINNLLKAANYLQSKQKRK
ncbi:MAG: sugar phosphate nucleotidyltransferase [Promethearchaeia archaeon]